jgi:hypothetical protein
VLKAFNHHDTVGNGVHAHHFTDGAHRHSEDALESAHCSVAQDHERKSEEQDDGEATQHNQFHNTKVANEV